MDIDSFKSVIGGLGVSQGNRYRVTVPYLSSDECKMALVVNAPTVNFNVFTWRNAGPVIRYPFEPIFEPLTIDFMVLGNGEPFNKLRSWQDDMVDQNFRFKDYADYCLGNDIIVEQLNEHGGVMTTFKYFNCYPQSVGPKSLSYENRASVERFPVTFFSETMKTIPGGH